MKTRWVVLGAMVLGATAPARGAQPKHGPVMGIGGPGEQCVMLVNLLQPLRATPGAVQVSDPVTLDWSAGGYPSSCLGVYFRITGPNIDRAVGHSGPQVVYPDNADTPYVLWAHKDDSFRELSRTTIQVQPQPLPQVDGRPNVAITSNGQVPLFVQAIGTPNAVIRIANDVQLDLSGRSDLAIAPGVQILGGRSSTERGAKLYTRTFPFKLFVLGRYAPADNVRISGLRIEGAESGIAADDTSGSDGITVYASINVDITNNEIYGWRGSAVNVLDSNAHGPTNRLPRVEATDDFLVRVTDNFIHHNQRYRSLGYGVSVDDGAYALIARNVFDYNRHAIAAGGGLTNGYWAQSNLVLEHGGLNSPTLDVNTHMFDVHGTDDCWGFELYCGHAGEKFWFISNTILYDAGTGIKMRGASVLRTRAEYNVFSHIDEWGGYLDDGAFAQTSPDGNFDVPNNFLGRFMFHMLVPSACDFNGDGASDSFLATGNTWWYYSSAGASWVYLRDSFKGLPELAAFGHFNADPYCDVRDGAGAIDLTMPGPELHGRRLQLAGTGALFLVLDGKRFRIPDAATYASLFRDQAGIEMMDVSAIPDGGTLSGAQLVRNEAGHVFLLASGKKYWVDSDDALDFFHLDPARIDDVAASSIAGLARGRDLSVGPGGYARAIVPHVTGQSIFSARPELAAAGFGYTTSTLVDCANVGIVLSQSPSAGTLATVGTRVRLTIGRMLPRGCGEEE